MQVLLLCNKKCCVSRALLYLSNLKNKKGGVNIFCYSSMPGRINCLTPNDPYMGRTAPLTSKRCILYIYSRNIGIEYFKNAQYSPFFFSSKCNSFHNTNLFGSCIIHILYTGCAKIKIIPAPKG